MKKEKVAKELLDKAVLVGRLSPSGSDSQSTHSIVIQNEKALDDLARLAREEFAKMEIQPDTYIYLKNSTTASKAGNYVFHYGAPSLIVLANKTAYGDSIADSAIAVEKMMLEANECKLASCSINQLRWLAKTKSIREYMLSLGMAEDETVCASMVLGYPDSEDGLLNRTEREIKGNPVTYVD